MQTKLYYFFIKNTIKINIKIKNQSVLSFYNSFLFLLETKEKPKFKFKFKTKIIKSWNVFLLFENNLMKYYAI